MEEYLDKEKRFLDFYDAMVRKSQVDTKSLEIFFEQAIACMLLGYECKDEWLANSDTYELLFMLNLSINGKYADLEELIGPFNIVDREQRHYLKILEDSHVLRKVIFFENLYDRIKRDREMVDLKYPGLLDTINDINKLKNIIRTGWIRRNVTKPYQESDSLHIAQMFGMASAYFTLFNPKDINKKKVMEIILIHEIGELLAGDIAELDSRHSTKRELEEQGVRNVFSKFKEGDYFIQLWIEFECKESNEARFVYELDKFDPVAKAKYLDEVLSRKDLYNDFYSYEVKRSTFENGYLKKVFKLINKNEKEGI